jgi:uncharacterized protein YbjQ (UPF0145 family)
MRYQSQQKHISFSTADTIPGEHRTASSSSLTWSNQCASIREAYDELAKWARDHDYDAVVGVRFVQTESYQAGYGNQWRWVAYGTAIAW